MELKAAAILAVLALLGWGLVAKSDKQSVHILEGKLHRLGKPTKSAKEAYKKHETVMSVVQFVVGLCLAFLAFILPMSAVAIGLGFVGAVLIVIGIVGRARTFRRADQELG